MIHDPLCYWHNHYKGLTPVQVDPENDKWEWIDICNDCDLIAKVREDERANVTAEFMSNHGDRWEYREGQRDMLRAAILAALNALEEKP